MATRTLRAHMGAYCGMWPALLILVCCAGLFLLRPNTGTDVALMGSDAEVRRAAARLEDTAAVAAARARHERLLAARAAAMTGPSSLGENAAEEDKVNKTKTAHAAVQNNDGSRRRSPRSPKVLVSVPLAPAPVPALRTGPADVRVHLRDNPIAGPLGLGGLAGLMPEDLQDDDAAARLHSQRRAKPAAAEADDDGDGDDDMENDADMDDDAEHDADDGAESAVDLKLRPRNRDGREWAKYVPSDPRFLPPTNIKFAFVHVPKAGGRTLECTLQWPMRAKGDYVGLELPQVIQDTPMRLTMGHREWEHVMPASYVLSDKMRKVREVISVMMVREPVTRVASEFFTGLRRPSLHQINQKPETWKSGHILCKGWIRKSLKAGNITLDQFANWPHADDLKSHWDRMVNMLTWKREGVLRLDLSPSEQYELAAARLARMDIIGVQERFSETMGLINCKLFEVTGQEMTHYNWCSNLNRYDHTITEATARRLRELNALDMRLYNEAVRLFDERVRFYSNKACFRRMFECPREKYCGRKFAMDREMETDAANLQSRNVICTKACRRTDLPPVPPPAASTSNVVNR